MNAYNWPIVGPWLRERARREGRRIGGYLLARGLPSMDIRDYVAGELQKLACHRDTAEAARTRQELLGILDRVT